MKLARYHGTHARSNASSPTMLSYRMLDHTISKKNCFASKIATKNGWPQPVLKGCPQTKWENNYSVEPRRKVGRPLRSWHAKLQEFFHREFPQHTTWLEAAQSPEWPGALIVFAIPTSTVELLTFCPMSFKDRSFELERAQSNVICPCQCQVLD